MTSSALLFTTMFLELGLEVAVDAAALELEFEHGIDCEKFWDLWRSSPGNFFGLHVASTCKCWATTLSPPHPHTPSRTRRTTQPFLNSKAHATLLCHITRLGRDGALLGVFQFYNLPFSFLLHLWAQPLLVHGRWFRDLSPILRGRCVECGVSLEREQQHHKHERKPDSGKPDARLHQERRQGRVPGKFTAKQG